MWEISLEEEAAQALVDGSLSEDNIVILERWIRLMGQSGPEALQGNRSRWHDHILQGAWFGYRSSRFSDTGRIIYRVDKKWQRIIVVRITNNHGYTREKG